MYYIIGGSAAEDRSPAIFMWGFGRLGTGLIFAGRITITELASPFLATSIPEHGTPSVVVQLVKLSQPGRLY
jgi:hypothetical protein